MLHKTICPYAGLFKEFFFEEMSRQRALVRCSAQLHPERQVGHHKSEYARRKADLIGCRGS